MWMDNLWRNQPFRLPADSAPDLLYGKRLDISVGDEPIEGVENDVIRGR